MTLATKEQAALTSAEQQLFEQHEAAIEKGLQTFYAVGYALTDIRDQRLYRAEYGTFEEYCQQRWNMNRRYANRLVQAAEIADNLGPIGPRPENEAQTRPLAKLTAEEQPEAWEEAVKRSGGKPTAKVVEQVVKERTQPPMPPEPEPEPEIPAEAIAWAEEVLGVNQQPVEPPELPPGWYFQDSSNPDDIIAINRNNHEQTSVCDTYVQAAARAWGIHQSSQQPERAAEEPAAAEESESNLDKMLRYGIPHDLAEQLERDHWLLLRQTAEADRFVFEKQDPFSKEVYNVSIADLQKLFAPLLNPAQCAPEPEPEPPVAEEPEPEQQHHRLNIRDVEKLGLIEGMERDVALEMQRRGYFWGYYEKDDKDLVYCVYYNRGNTYRILKSNIPAFLDKVSDYESLMMRVDVPAPAPAKQNFFPRIADMPEQQRNEMIERLESLGYDVHYIESTGELRNNIKGSAGHNTETIKLVSELENRLEIAQINWNRHQQRIAERERTQQPAEPELPEQQPVAHPTIKQCMIDAYKLIKAGDTRKAKLQAQRFRAHPDVAGIISHAIWGMQCAMEEDSGNDNA